MNIPLIPGAYGVMAYSRTRFATGCLLACAILYGLPAQASETTTGSSVQLSPAEALKRLREGNTRFVENKSVHQHSNAEWRHSVVKSQHPFAVVLGCSDSRVPPELVFDQGLGDLFVIRVAGNIAGVDECGSIEYAVEHLHAQLVMVLGHESCGAVTAAFGTASERGHEPVELQQVLEHIKPCLDKIPESSAKEKKVEAGVAANVRAEVSKLRAVPMFLKKEKENKLQVVGAVYHLDTGTVTILDSR